MNFEKILDSGQICVSVPCRVDLGGTLDIISFYLPLNGVSPSSFNIALDARTIVKLYPWDKDYVKVSSKGFKSAVFRKNMADFTHPLGLMFAVASYFNAHGVHIEIESSSPPRSALGGSSSAAVGLVSAFFHALGQRPGREQAAWLAHYIEASVAGVPCGMQDQLAAAFGGVNQWIWKMGIKSPEFERRPVFETADMTDAFNSNILVAYCGIPHVSKDINSQWVHSFTRGKTRPEFRKIAEITHEFSQAVRSCDFRLAADLMNIETRIRLEMTPDVLDNTGKKLFEMAVECGCGARFTGAGGGGCLWAVGEDSSIRNLKPCWQKILAQVEHGKILDTKIDHKGIIIN